MSKDKISDYSTTASNNTDIAGIGIQGTNAVSNFDGAFRTIMKQLADMNAGTPLFDTFSVCDPVDNTKKVRIDAGTVATATTRVLTMPNADVTISSFATTVLDDADAATARATLGADNATNLTSGTVADARLPTSMAGKTFTSAVTISSGGINSTGSTVTNTNGTTLSIQRNNANAVDIEAFQTTNTSVKHSIDLNRYGGAVTIAGSTVWHAGNDGAGSGLDADLLDGQSSAYYTDIVSRLGYTPVNKAGDTMTGDLVTSGKLSAKGTPVADRGIHVLGNATYGNDEYNYHQIGIYTNGNGANSLEAIIGADHFVPAVYIKSVVRGVGGGIIFLNGSDVRTPKLIPQSDNTYSLGEGAARWSVVYSATGAINTSDAREKLWLGSKSAEEGRVADRIRSIIGKYQWLDAIAQKGQDAARIHFGPTAQAVEEAFIAEGLDPNRYGIFCEDPIMEDYFETIEEEKPVTKQQTIEKTEIVIEGGVAVQRVVDHTETVPVMLEFPMVDEKGFPVFDDDGEPLMHSIPATETISRQVPRQRPSGDVRKGLRLSQLALFLLAA